MKSCNKCNSQNADDAIFCAGCGQALSSNIATQQTPNSNSHDVNQANVNIIRPTGTGRFVNADEYAIATLENGVVMNMISGEGFKTEDAILTNRRLYYNHKEGIVSVKVQEEKVDVKDITGTKIASYSPYKLLIGSILAFLIALISSSAAATITVVFILLALILLVLFFIGKKKHLKIEYPGGAIYFSVKKYGMKNIQLLQKCIHAVKDFIEDNR